MSGKILRMSATEILGELPKLTEAERRAVRLKLSELAAENEEIALCDQAGGGRRNDARPNGGRRCPPSKAVRSG